MPAALVIKSLPASGLTIDLRHHILFFGLATEPYLRQVAILICGRRTEQKAVLGINLRLVRQQLRYQRCSSFPIAGKLAGGEKQASSTITQYIVIIYFLTL